MLSPSQPHVHTHTCYSYALHTFTCVIVVRVRMLYLDWVGLGSIPTQCDGLCVNLGQSLSSCLTCEHKKGVGGGGGIIYGGGMG